LKSCNLVGASRWNCRKNNMFRYLPKINRGGCDRCRICFQCRYLIY
jgi:hypothetical protein